MRQIQTVLEETESLTERVGKLTKNVMDQAEKHTSLLRTAELLVIVGSITYFADLIDGLFFTPFDKSIEAWPWYERLGARGTAIIVACIMVAFLYKRFSGNSIFAWWSKPRPAGPSETSKS
jgi:hypothetical protein